MNNLNSLELLTPEEKEASAKLLLFQRFTNKEQLRLWGQFYLGVDLADCTVSRFATSNPLDMVWRVYSFCADETNEEPSDDRYIAGRSSQKTLSLAFLQVLLPLHFKRAFTHFGGTKAQAKRAYTYFKKFVARPYIKPWLKDEPTQEKSIFLIDGEEIEVEILSISAMAVQGPHSPAVGIDELAALSPDKIQAYEDISGVPVYTQDGKPWIKFGISSRKGAYTVIEREFEERESNGINFYFWTVLENTKTCPDSISGIQPYSYYANAMDNKAITAKTYSELTEMEKTKFEKVHARKGCFNCALAAVCAGDLKKQTSTCKTLRPTKSVIQEFKGAELSWFLSQKMSMSPSLEGVIFNKFKREIFEKTPTQMYECFTGKSATKEYSEEELISVMLQAGCKSVAGLDHGYTDPAVLCVFFEDGVGNIYVMRVYAQTGLDPEQLCDKIIELQNKYKFTHLYPDTAQPAINELIKTKRFVKVIDDYDKKGQIENGITLIRRKISPTSGGTKFFGLKDNCEFLCKELEKYHYEEDAAGRITDMPEDEFNHSIDATRYVAINRWDDKKKVLGAQERESKKETINEYQNIVRQQQADWLKQQIREAGEGIIQVSSSKNKGNTWSID